MKRNNKLARITFVALAIVLTFSVNAVAQKKKPVTPKKPAVNVTNALEIKQSAEKVSIQLKNVSKFLFLLGGIANGLEAMEKDARAGKMSKPQLDTFAQQKQAVITSIRNLKAGLSALEVDFRTKLPIKPYLIQVQGVTDLATQSEDLAAAGRFTDSGRVFLTVIERLSDTLTVMP